MVNQTHDSQRKATRYILWGLAGLTCISLWSCAAQRQYNADWPTLQRNSSRQADVIDAPVPPLIEKWRFQTQGRLVYPPIVKDGKAYLGSRDGNLYAINLTDGSKIWDTPLEQGGIFSSPTWFNGLLYAGKWAPFYAVYAFDAATGEQQWRKETGDLVNRPPWVLVDEQRLYTHVDPDLNQAEEIRVIIQAWDPKTQEIIWQQPLPGIPAVATALSETHLLVATNEEEVYALDRVTGEVAWKAPITGSSASAPLVKEGTIYLASKTGFIYALDDASGKLLWRYQYPDTSFSGDLAWSADSLFLPAGETLHRFGLRNREPIWRFRAPKVITGAVASRDLVYFGCDNKNLYVADLEKGFIKGLYRTGGDILAAPVLAAGLVLVSSSDNRLYAFEEGPRPKQPSAPTPNWINQR